MCQYCEEFKKNWKEMGKSNFPRHGGCLDKINERIHPLKQNTPYVGVHKKAEYECEHGHIWMAKPSNVFGGQGCSVCSGNAKKTTEQYRKELQNITDDPNDRRELIALEDYVNNGVKILHHCLVCEHEWLVRPSDVLNHGNNCPACSKSGFNPGRPGLVYYIRIEAPGFPPYWKIGITNNTTEERYSGENGYHHGIDVRDQMVIIDERNFESGADALAEELRIKRKYASELASNLQGFEGIKGFCGKDSTETFISDVLGLDK